MLLVLRSIARPPKYWLQGGQDKVINIQLRTSFRAKRFFRFFPFYFFNFFCDPLPIAFLRGIGDDVFLTLSGDTQFLAAIFITLQVIPFSVYFSFIYDNSKVNKNSSKQISQLV